MPATPTHPTLRLITTDVPRTQRTSPIRNTEPHPFTIAHEQIRAENAAASIAALDPRWILAVQVSRELQGGRAAILTPEARRRLVSTGQRLGLRPFDSNLVVAIVQDGARTGEDPLGRDVVARLRFVHSNAEPELADARSGPTWSMLIAWSVVVATLSATLTAALMLYLAR